MDEEKNVIDLGADILAPLKVELSGKPLDVVYRANQYTPELLDSGVTMPEALVKVVSDWGLTLGGQPVPITPEGMAKVPFVIQRAIWAAIQGDFNPSLNWPTNSSAS